MAEGVRLERVWPFLLLWACDLVPRSVELRVEQPTYRVEGVSGEQLRQGSGLKGNRDRRRGQG